MSQANLSDLPTALLRALPGVSRSLRGRRAAFAVFLGLLVLAAYLAARLTWQLASPAAATGGGIVAASGSVFTGSQTQPPAARIAAAHLFGTTTNGPRLAAADAPETSLDLTLLGVAAGTSGAPSRAIIASGNSAQSTYPVGATLPGGAVIRAILPDRVVLAHNGRLENLRLPVAGTSLLATKMNFGPGTGATSTIPPAPLGGPPTLQLRRQIEQHPQSLSRFMRLRAVVQNGQLKGYRVFPGEDPELFRKAGLQPGDIVTSVNGIDLNNPRNGLRAISRLRDASGPVSLVVLRQGKPVHLTVNVPRG